MEDKFGFMEKMVMVYVPLGVSEVGACDCGSSD